MSEERYISASDFKAHCLKLMDEVAAGRLSLVVTKHGRPVARIEAPGESTPAIIGCLEGTVRIHGDLTEPAEDDWDAAS